MKATIKAQDTNGKEQKVQIETDFPKMKTTTTKGVYVMEDLLQYAETGKLTDEMNKRSPALTTMKQAEAVSIVVDALAADSEYIKEVSAKTSKAAKEEDI